MTPTKVTHLDRREDIVKTMESLLERAKAGEIDSIGIAIQSKDGVGVIYQIGQRGNIWMLLGALGELEYRIKACTGNK